MRWVTFFSNTITEVATLLTASFWKHYITKLICEIWWGYRRLVLSLSCKKGASKFGTSLWASTSTNWDTIFTEEP